MARRTGNLLRSIDRYVGIPAVAAFALAPKRRRPADADIRRIGILKTAAIGDTLLLAGIPDALKERFPQARVVLVTGSDNAEAGELLGAAVDERVVVDPTRPLGAITALRRLDLDVLLECGPWPRIDALLGVLSGAGYRVGFSVAGQRRHYGFDLAVPHSSAVHQSENFRALARAIGVERFPEVRVSHGLETAPVIVRRAVLHPWSGGYMGHVKEWPTERWIELGRALADRGLAVLVSGSSGDAARSDALVAHMRAQGVDAISIAGRYSLSELAKLLHASALVVAVNTGVMHLAALVGAPTVSIEGPVPVRRWGPIGPRARSVITPLGGCGYLDLGFEYAGRRLDCMSGVTTGSVLLAIDELIAESP